MCSAIVCACDDVISSRGAPLDFSSEKYKAAELKTLQVAKRGGKHTPSAGSVDPGMIKSLMAAGFELILY